MRKSSPWWQLCRLRYCLLLPIALLFRVTIYLPYRWQMHLGKCLGLGLRRLDKRGRHVSLVNLSMCFPELTTAEQDTIQRKSYLGLGQSLFETFMAWFAPSRKLYKLRHMYGLENLHKAQQSKQGIILLSAHFTCLEIAGRLFAENYPVTVVYRNSKSFLIDKFAKYYRQKIYHKIIVREDLRSILKALRQNEMVWYTADIDAGERNSVFAPFFGITTATITATARLAKHTGAKVVPTFFYRRLDGTGYDGYFEAALENFPSQDPVKDATMINQVIETAIRRSPEQYLWQYKRFKTRPADVHSVY